MSSRIRMAAGTAILAVALVSTGDRAQAFHNGGVAECAGCHTMHNSLEGQAETWNNTPIGTTNVHLLKGVDASSTCLTCHDGPTLSSYHVSSIDAATPANRGPGGDFAWLKKTFNWIPRGTTQETSKGERHGHNIVAQDFGYVADAALTTAPGGTYDAAQLSCISCHDPHGKYRLVDDLGTIADAAPVQGTTYLPTRTQGSYHNSPAPTATYAVGVYRILGGIGYAPKSYSDVPFVNQVPAAIAPSSYNRTEAVTQTRVAYGSGMSEWCANCHTNMHNDNFPTTLRHPAGNGAKLTAQIAANYNMYVKTGDLRGLDTNSYWSLVPFETGHTNVAADRVAMQALARTDDSQLGGPTTGSNVMCLTCHRAHASGWDSMLRWNGVSDHITTLAADGLTIRYSQEGEATQPYGQGRTEAEALAAYYDQPANQFAPYQRSLCNKCHVKD